MNYLKSNKGSAVADVLIGAMIIVLVIFPVFSAVIEKAIIYVKSQSIKDAIDITNIATYNSISINTASKNTVSFDTAELQTIYTGLLAKNLNLNSDLTPAPGSIVSGPVTIDSLVVYTSGFPQNCPDGSLIDRPSIHSRLTIRVRPTLYREIILNALGKSYVELRVHVDSDIPVNN